VAGWPVTGRRRGGGVANITAAAWTAGFQWWRSGDITRTQNVSEYMLVLDLCLVYLCGSTVNQIYHTITNVNNSVYIVLCNIYSTDSLTRTFS